MALAGTNDHEKSKEIPKEEEEEEMSLWSELSLELVGIISKHVYATDPGAIATIRATCKSWNMINTINIRYPLPPPSNLIDDRYPYLLTLQDSTCKFVHPIYDHTFDLETPELSGAFIRCSRFGWLLVTGRDKIHFFFNPFTRERIDLPQVTYDEDWYILDRPPDCIQMYFSAPPTCVDCYIVGMEMNDFIILRPRSEYWESCGFRRKRNWNGGRIIPNYLKEHTLLYWISHCHPIILKEKCYFLGLNGRLIVFDFKSYKFFSVGQPFLDDEEEEFDSIYRSFLVKNGDELIAVFELKGEENIRIARQSLQNLFSMRKKKCWQPLINLDNKMLYISLKTSFLMKAPVKAAGNKIYFPNMRANECIFFSLATRKYHSYSNNYASKFPLDIKEFRNSTWFESLSVMNR